MIVVQELQRLNSVTLQVPIALKERCLVTVSAQEMFVL
jgi:hypothetical protein